MTDHLPIVHAAVVQAAPVLFDREATVDKACRLTGEAAAQGAQLILLPGGVSIPAYPRWVGWASARWWAAERPAGQAHLGASTGRTR